MNLADRIQSLRRRNGLSQEELAIKVGVSRETVLKWESGTLPELDKLNLLSDVFDVSCDYLLNGKEKDETDARIFFIVGSFLNFIGLMVSLMIWFEEQSSLSIPTGLMIMAVGCMVFMIGQYVGNHRKEAFIYFWLINIWFLSLIPLSFIFNFIQAILEGFLWRLAPIPMIGNNAYGFMFCWLFYIAFCVIIDYIILKRNK